MQHQMAACDLWNVPEGMQWALYLPTLDMSPQRSGCGSGSVSEQAVLETTVFWDVTSRCFVGRYQLFGVNCCLRLQVEED
jgi:hypothetical protein